MATTLTLRQTKGSPLTFGEMDSNLQSLDVNKQENIPNIELATSIDSSVDKILFYDNSTTESKSIVVDNVTAFVERNLIIKCVNDGIAPVVGNGIVHLTIPSSLNNKKLQSAEAHVYTAGTSGSITNVQLHNLTDGVDILSTPITIDLNETDSSTAATPHVVGANNTVTTADVIRVDVDVVATDTKGLEIRMVFGTA
jgi:hypothetical protein|tara:strand:- start:2016 stop:2606 length:591 start_codon:yes stop_codon:yes gene_type:complete